MTGSGTSGSEPRAARAPAAATRATVEHAPRVACFDVYDTVLTRSVGRPQSVFLLVGSRLRDLGVIEATPEVFARARMEAGRAAARNRRCEEIRLDEIYAELTYLLDWTADQRAAGVAAELAVEAALLRPVPGAAARLAEARAAGQQVVFLSDMYLGGEFLQAQLRHHELMLDGDLCFVSCDLGVKKRTGNAFREVARRLGVPLHAIVHVGNDPESDIAAGLRAGVQVVPFLEGNNNRYESILNDHAWASGGVSAVLAGASRLARLELTATGHAAILRDVGAGVAAPTLAGYVLWVLRRAQRQGLRRLYFVARDGEILLEIARELAPKLGLDIELRYLYGSRQAWHGPAMDRVTERELDWIVGHPGRSSLRALLARVELPPERIRSALEAAGFRESAWDAPLDAEERRRLGGVLQSPGAAATLIAVCRARRALLSRYLRQEGLLDDDRWAIVDVGWRGRVQASLSRVLAHEGRPPARGFYFGMLIDDPDPRAGTFDAYFFRHAGGAENGYFRAMWGYFQLLEMFCAGTHGSTLGYRDEGGVVVPVLKERRNVHVERWGIATVRASVHAFVRHLQLEVVDPWSDCRPAIAEVLRAFWTDPTPEEAGAWGGFPYEDDETGTAPLAQPFALRDVLRGLRLGELPLHNRSAWSQSSLLLTPPVVRWTLQQSVRASRLARRLLQPPRRAVHGAALRATRRLAAPEPAEPHSRASGA